MFRWIAGASVEFYQIEKTNFAGVLGISEKSFHAKLLAD